MIIKIPRRALGIALLLALALAFITVAFAAPEGVDSIAQISSERRTPPVAANISAQGGNITRLNITVRTQTAAWQGFAGNITGNVILDDASGDRFYQWNLTRPAGKVFAARNISVAFNSVFPQNNCTIDESLTGGFPRADRVNRTYFAGTNSVQFNITTSSGGTIAINSSTVCSTNPHINSSPNNLALFENIILTTDPNNASNTAVGGNTSVYVSIVEDNNVHGFDGQHYNFQMLVPVNRTSGFSTYFFFAELE